jgi:ribonuclease BN (tRNA processing enzyme)
LYVVDEGFQRFKASCRNKLKCQLVWWHLDPKSEIESPPAASVETAFLSESEKRQAHLEALAKRLVEQALPEESGAFSEYDSDLEDDEDFDIDSDFYSEEEGDDNEGGDDNEHDNAERYDDQGDKDEDYNAQRYNTQRSNDDNDDDYDDNDYSDDDDNDYSDDDEFAQLQNEAERFNRYVQIPNRVPPTILLKRHDQILFAYNMGLGADHSLYAYRDEFGGIERVKTLLVPTIDAEHAGGLPTLLRTIHKLRKHYELEEYPVPTYGPDGLLTCLNSTLASPSTRTVANQVTDQPAIEAFTFPDTFDSFPGSYWTLITFPLEHSPPSAGYIIQEPNYVYRDAFGSNTAKSGGRKIVIVGPTDDPSVMEQAAVNADILIYEASLPPGHENRAEEVGCSPFLTAAHFAHAINAGQLIITNHVPITQEEARFICTNYTPYDFNRVHFADNEKESSFHLSTPITPPPCSAPRAPSLAEAFWPHSLAQYAPIVPPLDWLPSEGSRVDESDGDNQPFDDQNGRDNYADNNYGNNNYGNNNYGNNNDDDNGNNNDGRNGGGSDYEGSDYEGSDYEGSDYEGSDYEGSDYEGSDYGDQDDHDGDHYSEDVPQSDEPYSPYNSQPNSQALPPWISSRRPSS